MSLKEEIAERLRQKEKENLAALKRDIAKARSFALKQWWRYIDEEKTPTGFFHSTAYWHIEFPDVDRLSLLPIKFGASMDMLAVEYRLVWEYGLLYWVGDIVIRRELLGADKEIKILIGKAEGRS